MKLLKANEWESASGKTYCNHPELIKYDNGFRAFELIWQMSPLNLMLFVIENYNAKVHLVKDESGSIKSYYFSFENYGKGHRFALDTNNQSKKVNITTVESFLELV